MKPVARKGFGWVPAPIRAALDALAELKRQALLTGESPDIEKLPGFDVEALREDQVDERCLALADLAAAKLRCRRLMSRSVTTSKMARSRSAPPRVSPRRKHLQKTAPSRHVLFATMNAGSISICADHRGALIISADGVTERNE